MLILYVLYFFAISNSFPFSRTNDAKRLTPLVIEYTFFIVLNKILELY